jgi:gas vesicle structural protein
MADEEFELGEDEELSLLETLDHVLDRGLVIAGEVTIAVADVDLIYLGLNLLVGSVETVNRVLGERERRVELLRGRALAARSETDDARRATDDALPRADGVRAGTDDARPERDESLHGSGEGR